MSQRVTRAQAKALEDKTKATENAMNVQKNPLTKATNPKQEKTKEVKSKQQKSKSKPKPLSTSKTTFIKPIPKPLSTPTFPVTPNNDSDDSASEFFNSSSKRRKLNSDTPTLSLKSRKTTDYNFIKRSRGMPKPYFAKEGKMPVSPIAKGKSSSPAVDLVESNDEEDEMAEEVEKEEKKENEVYRKRPLTNLERVNEMRKAAREGKTGVLVKKERM